MKVMIAIVSVLISVSAFAAGKKGYSLKMDLTVDGKHIDTVQLKTEANKNASMTFQLKPSDPAYFIDVIASEYPKTPNSIMMKLIVGKINADDRRITLATPQIIALENNQAQVTEGHDDGTSVDVKVTAKRIEIH